MALYDDIGFEYNTTRKADPFIVERIKFHLADKIYPESKFLDLGCGTGNYTVEFELEGMTGLDPSERMLNEARHKSKKINWLAGTAEELPFDDATFDAVLCVQTVHHWKNFEIGIENIYRVLKNQGSLLIFTSTKEQMEQYWLNHYFPGMMANSILKMPSFQTIRHACLQAGFATVHTEKYFIREGLEDLFLYSGKNNPFLYFNPSIRKGISSFANGEHGEEILNGLKRLNTDLQTGYFKSIKENYHEDPGDYIFFLVSKKAF